MANVSNGRRIGLKMVKTIGRDKVSPYVAINDESMAISKKLFQLGFANTVPTSRPYHKRFLSLTMR